MDATQNRRGSSLLIWLVAAAAWVAGLGAPARWSGAAEKVDLPALLDSLPAPNIHVDAQGHFEAGRYAVDPYLRAAAELQARPANEAGEILLAAARRHEEKLKKPFNIDDRTIILCRMLFSEKPGAKARPLRTMFCAFLGGTDYPAWPLYPIELVDGVPLLIAQESPGLAGQPPESAQSYVRYCLDHCEWNPIRYTAKTPAEKSAALAKLLASRKWKVALEARDKKYLSAQIQPPAP